MAYITLSQKGQVTLPARMRKKLGLSPGAQLEVQDEGRTIVLKPVGRFDELKGFLGRGQSPAAERRGMMKGLAGRRPPRRG